MSKPIEKIQSCRDQLLELYDKTVDTTPPEIYGTILGLHQLLDEALAQLSQPCGEFMEECDKFINHFKEFGWIGDRDIELTEWATKLRKACAQLKAKEAEISQLKDEIRRTPNPKELRKESVMPNQKEET